jgi:GNAT superfamily N-acetyltransferase
MQKSSELASAALVDSLRSDPFYGAISDAFVNDEARRCAILARYFDYSMREGARAGRLAVWPDPSIGAAVWQLPMEPSVASAESRAKRAFLVREVGARGAEKYQRIVDFMRPRAAAVIEPSAWYLSIVGVARAAQGQGIGPRLLQPTIVEADAAGVDCYLETFDRRNPRFYERLGFAAVGVHLEPVTGASYTIMLRRPRSDTLRQP